ncbi:MAG: hypothetical protein GXO33_01450 [Epsilonproteobacteria bacterium]|nr:hypothetical protein [Campylobacterota bacterium]
MGNQLLIKVALAATGTALLLYAQSPLEKIDRLINQIKQPRKGLTHKEILASFDPFVHSDNNKTISVKKPAPKPRRKFTLTAVFNDRVKLNGKWYKQGDRLYGYIIAKVTPDAVTLKRGRETVHVSMRARKKSNIKLIQTKD